MKKLLIPVILTATILIGATFAVMPVEKASTVHTTILSTLCNALFGVTTCPGGVTAITLPASTSNVASFSNIAISRNDQVVLAQSANYTLIDLHHQVAVDKGFVVITNWNGTATISTVAGLTDKLQLCVSGVSGAPAITPLAGGCTFFAQLQAAGVSTPQILHAHIPSVAGTILVNLKGSGGTGDTIPGSSQIAITIEKIV